MTALGSFALYTLPTPLLITNYQAAAPPMHYTGIVTIATLPVPIAIAGYAIGGTLLAGSATPKWGQLWPRGDYTGT